jgi:hypothetical protein
VAPLPPVRSRRGHQATRWRGRSGHADRRRRRGGGLVYVVGIPFAGEGSRAGACARIGAQIHVRGAHVNLRRWGELPSLVHIARGACYEGGVPVPVASAFQSSRTATMGLGSWWRKSPGEPGSPEPLVTGADHCQPVSSGGDHCEPPPTAEQDRRPLIFGALRSPKNMHSRSLRRSGPRAVRGAPSGRAKSRICTPTCVRN